MCPGGVAHDEDAFRVAPVFADAVVDKGDRFCDILDMDRMLNGWGEAIVGADEEKAIFGEEGGFGVDHTAIGFVTCPPASAMDHDEDRELFTLGGSVNVKAEEIGIDAIDLCVGYIEVALHHWIWNKTIVVIVFGFLQGDDAIFVFVEQAEEDRSLKLCFINFAIVVGIQCFESRFDHVSHCQ